MNKQLIKTYFEEFKHWLNGGSILVKYANPKQAAPGYTDWHEDDSVWNSNLDYLIVINDDYAIYRKALAEGKTLQYNFSIPPTNYDKYPTYWQDLDPIIGILSDRAHPNQYRIKPEEPKFKVGDWIRVNGAGGEYIGKVTHITNNVLTTNNDSTCYFSQAEIWEPQPGEVCIFWDNTLNYAKISKFSHIKLNIRFVDKEDIPWQNCMPFLGELSPNLKD